MGGVGELAACGGLRSTGDKSGGVARSAWHWCALVIWLGGLRLASHSGGPVWPGGLGPKLAPGCTMQWARTGKSFPIFIVFYNCIQMIQLQKYKKGHPWFQNFPNFSR
jgi:hypothetical protein